MPPVKPLKLQSRLYLKAHDPQDPPSAGMRAETGSTERPDDSPRWEGLAPSDHAHGDHYSYVERLRQEGDGTTGRGEGGEGEDCGSEGGLARPGRCMDRSSYHNAIAALESTSEEDDEGRGKSRGEGLACIGDGSEEEGSGRKRRRARGKGGFQRPLVETASTFRPSEFCSRLLPAENKPLEMVVLRRSKELVLRHDHRSIARHMLAADCQVGTGTHTHTYTCACICRQTTPGAQTQIYTHTYIHTHSILSDLMCFVMNNVFANE